YREYKEGAEKIVEQKKLEMEKQRKLAEMASKSIETIVPQLMSQSGYVLPRLIKSPYKIYFLNIPYFMRVRKRLDAEKIRKIG
ncbi:MAG: hypothetical protein II819_10975, partial [Fibrobacter sp.]|nr:hypothetical protein [Fibrobacter sp.]